MTSRTADGLSLACFHNLQRMHPWGKLPSRGPKRRDNRASKRQPKLPLRAGNEPDPLPREPGGSIHYAVVRPGQLRLQRGRPYCDAGGVYGLSLEDRARTSNGGLSRVPEVYSPGGAGQPSGADVTRSTISPRGFTRPFRP